MQNYNVDTLNAPFAHEVAKLASDMGVPAHHGLILAAILFVIGLAGVMARRNVLFMLMSLEIMMNSAALAFVVGGNMWGKAELAKNLLPSLGWGRWGCRLCVPLSVFLGF